MLQMNTAQLYLAMSLSKAGFPQEFVEIFQRRCGASQEDWQAMYDAGFIRLWDKRYWLTKVGMREYRTQKVGKYF